MIQFITNYEHELDHLSQIEMACAAGCKWIQLRMKNNSIVEIEEIAKKAQAICSRYNATLILNDNVELTRELNLDGVHLGQNDMPLSLARRMLGSDFIIGVTANTNSQINEIDDANCANYIGLGPYRGTKTKKNLSPTLGLNSYQDLLKNRLQGIPVIAIGGILDQDVPELIAAGCQGVAVSGYLLSGDFESNFKMLSESFKNNLAWTS